MTKADEEKWIIDRFIDLSISHGQDRYTVVEKIPTSKAPGPDFVIKNGTGQHFGAEVCTLYDFPSSENKHQRVICDQFEASLKLAMQAKELESFSLGIYKYKLPSKKAKLDAHINKIITSLEELKKLEDIAKWQGKPCRRIVVDGHAIMVLVTAITENSPQVSFFMFEDNGVQNQDHQNWLVGLKERLEDKEICGNKYLKSYPNWLIIYDNTNYGIFLNNVHETVGEMDFLPSEQFNRIVLILGQRIFTIAEKARSIA